MRDKLIEQIKNEKNWYTYEGNEGVIMCSWDIGKKFPYDVFCDFEWLKTHELEEISSGKIKTYLTYSDKHNNGTGKGEEIQKVTVVNVEPRVANLYPQEYVYDQFEKLTDVKKEINHKLTISCSSGGGVVNPSPYRSEIFDTFEEARQAIIQDLAWHRSRGRKREFKDYRIWARSVYMQFMYLDGSPKKEKITLKIDNETTNRVSLDFFLKEVGHEGNQLHSYLMWAVFVNSTDAMNMPKEKNLNNAKIALTEQLNEPLDAVEQYFGLIDNRKQITETLINKALGLIEKCYPLTA
jgi:hypothetical protein